MRAPGAKWHRRLYRENLLFLKGGKYISIAIGIPATVVVAGLIIRLKKIKY
jgi:hypothetical protein